MQSEESLEVVLETMDATEAAVVKSLLEGAGIPYLTRGEDAYDAFRGAFRGTVFKRMPLQNRVTRPDNSCTLSPRFLERPLLSVLGKHSMHDIHQTWRACLSAVYGRRGGAPLAVVRAHERTFRRGP